MIKQMFSQNFLMGTIVLTDTSVEIRKYLLNSKIPWSSVEFILEECPWACLGRSAMLLNVLFTVLKY